MICNSSVCYKKLSPIERETIHSTGPSGAGGNATPYGNDWARRTASPPTHRFFLAHPAGTHRDCVATGSDGPVE